MENLQEIINERAKTRATSVVRKLVDAFKSNHDLHELCADFYVIIPGEDPEKNNEKRDDLRSAFWNTRSPLPRMMVEILTKKYIPEESEKFVEDVERLKSEIDDLTQTHV